MPGTGSLAPPAPASPARTVSTISAPADPATVQADPILSNPNEAYRAAVRAALVDAMLEHTRGLRIGATEWLTIAARSSDTRPRLAPADPEGQTNLLSIRGADLAAFLAGQITHEEVLQRVDVRVF
jgi:hypothetical protein